MWCALAVQVTRKVNLRFAHIFNRVFEVPESAKKAQNLTENGLFETRGFAFTMAALDALCAYRA
jgi:hypothetical protein